MLRKLVKACTKVGHDVAKLRISKSVTHSPVYSIIDCTSRLHVVSKMSLDCGFYAPDWFGERKFTPYVCKNVFCCYIIHVIHVMILCLLLTFNITAKSSTKFCFDAGKCTTGGRIQLFSVTSCRLTFVWDISNPRPIHVQLCVNQ